MLWLGDVDGKCVFLNRAHREFWGVPPDLAGFSWSATLHPEDTEKLAGPYQSAMRDRTAFEVEARYRRADGQWRLLHTAARPRFSSAGQFLGMVGVNTDVTDQRAAERSLRQTTEQLDFALDAASEMGTWVLNASDGLLSGDRRFAAAFGLATRELAQGIPLKAFIDLVAEDDRSELSARFSAASASGERFQCAFRTNKISGQKWFSLVGRSDGDEFGLPRRLAGVIMDVHELKTRELQLDLLTRELSHRIKNIFAVVGSMARLTARDHPAAADAIGALQGRISAMSAVYAQVTPSNKESGHTTNLRQLIDEVFAPYKFGNDSAVAVEAIDIDLNESAASSFALIFHELATNSSKYGALAEGRHVQFSVKTVPGDALVFAWTETGGDTDILPPDTEGFGSKLIRMSALSIDGEIATEWRRTGLHWQMSVPLARIQ